MSEPMPGGHRRIDRVLAEDFRADLAALPLAELRERRAEALQEETDLSFQRRLLQGWLDIVRAELARRNPSAADQRVLDHLADVLAEDRPEAAALGRHLMVTPSRVDEHRRAAEQLFADVGISDVEARSADELVAAAERLLAHEQALSRLRRRVQAVLDACAAELARRYRDGEADVADLLPRR